MMNIRFADDQNTADETDGRQPVVWDADAVEGPSTPAQLGQHLRRERELRGITLGEIAQAARINPRYLAAIEEGRFEALPAVPFVKGFLTAYARHIGVPAEDVLTFYDEVLQANLKEEEEPGKAPRRRLWIWVVAGLVALAAIVLVAVLLRPRVPEPTVAPPPEAVAVPELPPAAAPEVPPTVEEAPVGAPEVAAPAAAGIEISLRGIEKTKVNAVIDERTVKDFYLQRGETWEVSGERSVVLSLWNAGGVGVTFNGRDLGSLGPAGVAKQNILFTLEGGQPVWRDRYAESPGTSR